MARVMLRQKAIDDLSDIWAYTFQEWSEKQADKYYLTLELACKRNGENPELGKSYESIKSNLRGLRIGRHIIFYQMIAPHEIEIVRILHERMDLKRQLL